MPPADSDAEHKELATQEPESLSQGVKGRSETKIAMLRAGLFSGPLPPPDVLKGYDNVFPGCAERIVEMAERQSAHRQSLEKSRIDATNMTERLGQIFAFTLGLIALVGGIYLISIDKDGSGLAAIVVALGSLVGAFLYGKRAQTKELAAKRRPFDDREEAAKQLRLFGDSNADT